jgi:hypothetical protein
MHQRHSIRWVGKSRASSALVLAAAMVAFAAGPSPATTSRPELPPKVKESEARSPGFRPPSPTGVTASVAESTRMGFCGGDDWEPEITADSFGHVYVVWPHFPGDPTCDPASGNPRDVYIQVSGDGGETFGPPQIVVDVPYPNVVDTVVTTNESGVVYVSFIAYGHDNRDIDVIVARSADFGASFTWIKVNGPECTVCDHPWIVASGSNVYVTYASGKNHYLSRSSDGGFTWTETNVLKAGGVAFPEGGVIDSSGNAWFAWGDCNGACSGKTAAVYRVSRTLAGTSTTTFAEVASAPAGPDCPFPGACGFAYFGPQNDIAIDAAGNLYMVWQDGQVHTKPKSPPIVQLSSCPAERDCARSSNWTYVGRADDKTSSGCAGSACYALFPRVEGAGAEQISVIWMDDRSGAPLDHKNGWNVWYRSSTTGGTSWTGPSIRVSTFDPSREESEPHGFRFPYGDYHGIDITPGGNNVMIWGEGIDYVGGPAKPGHIVYASLA